MTRSLRSGAGGLSLVFVGNAVSGILNLATQIFLARKLGASVIGDYGKLSVAIDIAILLVNFGFNQAVIRLRATAESLAAGYVLVCAQAVAAGLIATIIFWVGSSTGMVVVSWSAMLVMLVARVCGLFATMTYAQLEADLKYSRLVLLQVVAAACGAFVVLIGVGEIRNAYILLLRDLTVAVALLVGAILATSSIGQARGASRSAVAAALPGVMRFSWSMWKLNVMERIALRSDYVIAGALLGSGTFGLYFQIRGLLEGLLGYVLSPIQTVWFAFLCHATNRAKLAAKVVMLAIVLGVPAAILLAVAASIYGQALVIALLGRDWGKGHVLLPSLVMYALGIVVFELMKVRAMADGNHDRIVICRVMQIAVATITSIVLIRKFGLLGAGIATATGALVAAGASLLVGGGPRKEERHAVG